MVQSKSRDRRRRFREFVQLVVVMTVAYAILLLFGNIIAVIVAE